MSDFAGRLPRQKEENHPMQQKIALDVLLLGNLQENTCMQASARTPALHTIRGIGALQNHQAHDRSIQTSLRVSFFRFRSPGGRKNHTADTISNSRRLRALGKQKRREKENLLNFNKPLSPVDLSDRPKIHHTKIEEKNNNSSKLTPNEARKIEFR